MQVPVLKVARSLVSLVAHSTPIVTRLVVLFQTYGI